MSTMVGEPSTAPAPGSLSAGAVSAWRPLLRLGWRDARRRKGRTALVVLLVALPVGLLLMAAVVLQSADLTKRQRDGLTLGHTADAVFDSFVVDGATAPTDPTPPTWQKAVVEKLGYLRVKANGKFRYADVIRASLTDPLLAGAYVVTGGTAPTAPDTAAVSTDLARRYGVHVGDTIAMRDGQSFRVVGTFEKADSVRNTAVLLTVRPDVVTKGRVGIGLTVFAKAPSTEEAASFLSSAAASNISIEAARVGVIAQGPAPFADRGRFMPTVILYTLGTTGLFLVGIVISAAFAVSARRQLRTLGLLSANGATPSVLARVMAGQGLVTGAAGTLAGFGLGAAGLAVLAPHLNRLLGRRLPGLVVPPVQLAVIAAMGVATAALAAWVPGRAVARVPTLAALGGRRPVEPVRAHVPVLGVILFAGGLVLLGATSAAGTSSGELSGWARMVGAIGGLMLGGVLCMPWLVGRLESVAQRWKGARRLAARSLARNRSRSGPIAAAILVTAGAAMVAATYDESSHAATEQFRARVDPRSVSVSSYSEDAGQTVLDPPDDVLARVREILPKATVVRLRELAFNGRADVPRADGFTPVTFVTMDEASVRALAGDAAAAAFASGSAIVLNPPALVVDGAVTLRLEPEKAEPPTVASTATSVSPGGSSTVVSLPATAAPDPVDLYGRPSVYCQPGCPEQPVVPVVVLPERLATVYGFSAPNGTSVQFRLNRLLSGDELQQIRELNTVLDEEATDRAERTGVARYTRVNFDDVGPARSRTLQLILTSMVLVLALGVAGIGLALTTTENRADDATLLALGAPPRFRRRVRFWEALLLTAAGGVLAAPLGYIVGAVAIANGTSNRPLPFPWRTGAVLAIAMPLLAAALFGLLARTPRVVLLRED